MSLYNIFYKNKIKVITILTIPILFKLINNKILRLILFFIGSIALGKLKKFFEGGVCKLKTDLKGKVIIITGCNSGIGEETAKILCSLGATIILANKNLDSSKKLLNHLQFKYGPYRAVYINLDLGDFDSIHKFVK